MSISPRWIIRGYNDPVDYPQRQQPEPPREQPTFMQRVGNFFTRTVPEWFNSQWGRLRNFFSIGGNNTRIEGVDTRLLHVAAAMGMCNVHNGGCTCTDGMRSRNAGFGASNSRHIDGNALDVSLSSFPSNVRGKPAQEQYVADIATVLGYGSNDINRTLVASRHGNARGGGEHMHFQFGPVALGNVGYTPAGTDVAAAERRLLRYITPERLAEIRATRIPDHLANGPIHRYTGYQQQHPPQGPRLVYSQAGPQPYVPRPTVVSRDDQHPVVSSRWIIGPRLQG